jgi:hypothetical protein
MRPRTDAQKTAKRSAATNHGSTRFTDEEKPR